MLVSVIIDFDDSPVWGVREGLANRTTMSSTERCTCRSLTATAVESFIHREQRRRDRARMQALYDNLHSDFSALTLQSVVCFKEQR